MFVKCCLHFVEAMCFRKGLQTSSVSSTLLSDHSAFGRWPWPGSPRLYVFSCIKVTEDSLHDKHWHLDELVQERCNFSALAVELRLSCTNSSICAQQPQDGFQSPGCLRPNSRHCCPVLTLSICSSINTMRGNKMAAILQTFSNSFSLMEIAVFCLKFHGNLLLRVL